MHQTSLTHSRRGSWGGVSIYIYIHASPERKWATALTLLNARTLSGAQPRMLKCTRGPFRCSIDVFACAYRIPTDRLTDRRPCVSAGTQTSSQTDVPRKLSCGQALPTCDPFSFLHPHHGVPQFQQLICSHCLASALRAWASPHATPQEPRGVQTLGGDKSLS